MSVIREFSNVNISKSSSIYWVIVHRLMRKKGMMKLYIIQRVILFYKIVKNERVYLCAQKVYFFGLNTKKGSLCTDALHRFEPSQLVERRYLLL